jgi:Ca-activated chloride channel family protein
VKLELPAESDNGALPKLWAAERIREWDAASLDPRRQKAMKERITKLAVEHGIASRYTAFVVVETREGARKMSAQPQTRVVPVNLPAGWAMFQTAKPTPPPQLMHYARAMAAPTGFPGQAPPPAPSPARMAPPSAGAPASASGRASSGARGIGGAFGKIVDRARAAFDDTKAKSAKGAKADEGGVFESFDRFEMAEEAESSDPIVAILGRQLASGLWTENSKTDEDTLVGATSRALLELLRAGVTTAHRVHGEQVRKAIEALITLAEKIAARDPKAAELALGVAWLLASGRRTRKHIEDAIAATRSLDALRAHLGDEGAMREHVDRLAAC